MIIVFTRITWWHDNCFHKNHMAAEDYLRKLSSWLPYYRSSKFVPNLCFIFKFSYFSQISVLLTEPDLVKYLITNNKLEMNTLSLIVLCYKFFHPKNSTAIKWWNPTIRTKTKIHFSFSQFWFMLSLNPNSSSSTFIFKTSICDLFHAKLGFDVSPMYEVLPHM